MMNPEVKAAWVAALRSGEYEQTTGSLRNVGGYCCLGVLSDVHRKMTGDGSWSLGRDGTTYITDADFETPASDYPPNSVLKWAGLEYRPVDDSLGAMVLAEKNDEGRWSFEQIADLIEEKL